MTLRFPLVVFFIVCCGCASARTAGATESARSWASNHYELDGRAPWKPTRVFNVGEQTYIDFPPAVRTTVLPALLIEQADGGERASVVYVHYDPKRCRMRVEGVFDRALLVAGAGQNQERIRIRRVPPRALRSPSSQRRSAT